jgi:hypothetical protein
MIGEVRQFSWQFSQDGLPTFDSIADCNLYGRPERKKCVHSRPKPDQAESFTEHGSISWRNPTNNPSGNQPGYLHTQYFRSLHRPNHQSILLVSQRRIRFTGDQKQTWLVLHILNNPFTGNPIDMHIEDIQEDADPDGTIFDEPGFEFLFDRDHFPVTRREDETWPLGNHAGGIAKKPRDKERQNRRSNRRNDPTQPSCQQCNADSRPDEGNSLFGKRNADGTIRHRVASG